MGAGTVINIVCRRRARRKRRSCLLFLKDHRVVRISVAGNWSGEKADAF